MCDRGPGDFPAPVARRQSSNPLWSWTEVEAWFARYDPEAVPALGLRLSPDFIAEVNDRLGLRERLRHSPNAPWRPGSACCWFQQSRFEFSRQSAVPQRWREPLPFTPGGHSSPGRCSPCQPKQDHGHFRVILRFGLVANPVTCPAPRRSAGGQPLFSVTSAGPVWSAKHHARRLHTWRAGWLESEQQVRRPWR
jgi:hypothetical protein